jgi:WD40 repeat protein
MQSLKIFVISCFIGLVPFSYSWAGEPPTDPILRIETGMHTAPIIRVGVDRMGRFLVTVSWDKTIRVWGLNTGQQIRVIRPPIGEGNEGKLFAVALSPDGNTIACGGWTGWNWEKQGYIYLFDRVTGNLKKRITGLPNVVHHLVFSPDGRHLAACLLGKGGIHIFRRDTWHEIAQDRNYGDDSRWADFDMEGRLVTSCYDGYIRLYDQAFRLVAKAKTPGGEKPRSVNFSPDGKKIAVGFVYSTNVNVLSGKDLSILYTPDTRGVQQGSLFTVSFSSDGSILYAGGSWGTISGQFICKWEDGGRSIFIKDIPTGANSTITHILPLKDGSMVYGSFDPAFGVITPENRIRTSITPSIADYRNNQNGFLLSPDGMTVNFGYEINGKSPASFSISSRLLASELRTPNPELKPPITEASSLTITDWRNTETPRLKGQVIKLYPFEASRSLSIAPGDKTFLLGTESFLRLYNQEGKQQWQIPTPGAAWAVNISGNGKLAVAAFGDGTIRWYRMTDGKELLAFFPHKDKKRWVLWTPKGYYDCSANGEELIGWHVNNGKDQAADFFPVSKFRSIYFRPDVVARVLETLNEEEALNQANQEAGRKKLEVPIKKMLPPVVTIVSPEDGAAVSNKEITLR